MAPPNLDQVLAELQNLKDAQTENRKASLVGAINNFAAAAGSASGASSAYVDAVKSVKFDTGSGSGTKFTEWRQSKSDLLSNRAFRAAAQLHLKYLLITLRQIGEPDTEARMIESMAYIQELSAARAEHGNDFNKTAESKSLLNEPLSKGVYAQAAGVAPLIETLKTWEKSPGNLEGILNQNVRRILQEKKDPRLIDTWNTQIGIEKELNADEKSASAAENFATIRLPRLEWQKAMAFNQLDQPIRALSDMLIVIRKYPTHPDIENWLQSATEIVSLQKSQTGSPVAPAD